MKYSNAMVSTDSILRAYETYGDFRRFIEWALSRKRNASVTSLDVFERKLALNRSRCVKLARWLDTLGFAKFVVGRHKHKSRLLWTDGLWKLADIVTAPLDAQQ